MSNSEEEFDIGTLDHVLKIVAKLTRHNTRLTHALIFSFVLDMIFTVTIGYEALHLHADTIAAQRVACISSNEFRADSASRWAYYVKIDSLAHPNVSELKIDKEILSYVNSSVKPLNCTKLYG